MKALRDSQLHLLWTARIDYSEGSRVEAHQHDDYDQLLVILSGNSGEVSIGEKRYPVKESSVYLFLRGVTHSFQFDKQAITLDFKFKLCDRHLVEAFAEEPSYCPCRGTALPEIKQWYKMSLLQMRNPDSIPPMRIEAGFKSTLVSLMHEAKAVLDPSFGGPYTSIYPTSNGNEPIVNFVKENFAQKITLQLLADQFGFNPNYLVKIFNDITGMPPIQFLQEIRLEKAMEYLEFTALPITEVAEKVGWTLPYFSKMVKKRLGMTASQYRESLVNAVGIDINLELDFANEWRIEQQ
ncbi:helix-turn-helix domain-containing protein [Paenibacillus sp. LMG 31456]|uniref:Helix-turn-helix domain-containing protein n=1 Tax=Paenibacillus foliorum TaxID=2654974 RepID=A0A972H0V5_9BACL|nr:AraC family transcriptional regulator [Paenibacillus foliorum]NOU96510.1 helix-turn-helix domain-containing protein [Paenibacillus foliorum]